VRFIEEEAAEVVVAVPFLEAEEEACHHFVR